MRWPRGKYNGFRIVGVHLKVEINVTRWRVWMPTEFNKAMGIGPIVLRWGAQYDDFPETRA